jgi:hypothetical protein
VPAASRAPTGTASGGQRRRCGARGQAQGACARTLPANRQRPDRKAGSRRSGAARRRP